VVAAAADAKPQKRQYPTRPPVAVKYTVPHMIVPTTIHQKDAYFNDAVSSIGGTCGDVRPTLNRERVPGFAHHSHDLEQGRRLGLADSKRPPSLPHPSQRGEARKQQSAGQSTSRGWLSRRSDLELCLIGFVVSSVATLAVLVVLMGLSKSA
jgi:hypothetical protein